MTNDNANPEWLQSLIDSHGSVEQWGIQPQNIRNVAKNADAISRQLTRMALSFHPDNPDSLPCLCHDLHKDDSDLGRDLAQRLPSDIKTQLSGFADRLAALAHIYHENATILRELADTPGDISDIQKRAQFWSEELKRTNSVIMESYQPLCEIASAREESFRAYYDGETPWQQEEKRQDDKDMIKRLTQTPISEEQLKSYVRQSLATLRQRASTKLDDHCHTLMDEYPVLLDELKTDRAAKEIPAMIE
jgi:hypothetical protein